ncbi:CLUMA_CG004069, isoform A [Clunio marinus]|uniref:CLUMA_CG004069, isoform A n=1 Tax=Clunio marinus TaxID=568069 RepID=A0A1J1HVW6_9DIPT|nr:CLUMA_CG004069, isoform A [Clunio marinus]
MAYSYTFRIENFMQQRRFNFIRIAQNIFSKEQKLQDLHCSPQKTIFLTLHKIMVHKIKI